MLGQGAHCRVPLTTQSQLKSQQFKYHPLRLFDLSLLGISPGRAISFQQARLVSRSQDQEKNTIISASPAAMYRSGRVLGPKYYSDLRCSRTTRNTAEGDGDKESRACELTTPDSGVQKPGLFCQHLAGSWEAGLGRQDLQFLERAGVKAGACNDCCKTSIINPRNQQAI